MFQSLIGRLKTLVSVDEMGWKKMFQSLIGRLKTSLPSRSVKLDSSWFQSLIGRLKTNIGAYLMD